jgi:hypothetical protein
VCLIPLRINPNRWSSIAMLVILGTPAADHIAANFQSQLACNVNDRNVFLDKMYIRQSSEAGEWAFNASRL